MKFLSAESLQIIKDFRLRSIFFKYLKITTTLILLPFLLINVITYFTYANISNKKIADSFKQSVIYTKSNLSDVFDAIDNIYVNVSNDYNIINFFNRPNNNDYLYKVTPSLTSYLGKADGIDSISLYNFSVPYVFSTKDGGTVEKFADTAWLRHYNETKQSTAVFHSTVYDYSTQLSQNLLTFCYGYYRNSICEGLIVINYKFSAVSAKLASSENKLILSDAGGVILYADDEKLLNTNIADTANIDKATNDLTQLTVEKNLNRLTASYLFSEKKLTMTVISGTNAYAEQARYLRWILFVIIIVACILPIIVAFYVSVQFYKTISDIIRTFGSLENSQLSEKADDEINLIIENLRNLLNKNETIENELVKNLAVLKKAQSTALQLQFNHHFLFNTLNLISMSARTEPSKDNTTAQAIALLSDLLRTSLDTEQFFIPISSEIMLAKKYIDIEQLKLKNMFRVDWDVDESLYNSKIIKLVFQPIIENAFRHGLRTLPGGRDKRLMIRGFSTGDDIEFHFIDNGKGIPPEKLAQLKEMLNSSAIPESNHIGLANVNTRIKLMFGEAYGVRLHSVPGETDVAILIPNKI